MNPYISVWFNTRKTIEEKLQSGWVNDHGMIPYLLYGITSSIWKSADLLLLGINSIITIVIVIALGFVVGLAVRAIGVHVIYYFGKIWKGSASKREIDTVLSLSLIPNIIVSTYLVIIILISWGDVYSLNENNILILVIYIFSIRILIIGISRVQKFSYGLSILNIWLPQILVVLIYLLIRGML